MQNEPEKTAGSYNELKSAKPLIPLPRGVIELQTDDQHAEVLQEIIQAGLNLVNTKVKEILGGHNKLTNTQLVFPRVKFTQTYPEDPNCAGYFLPHKNEITLVGDKIKNDPLSRTKVFIHEYIHFLCHNGRDDSEKVTSNSPIATGNNIGFHRNFGLDIREGKEGGLTTDYFLSFNEAVTEQLAIDILPGVHETYSDYRGLLNQVIDDAVTRKLGSKNNDGVFVPWSREQIKNHIYVYFFRGDLASFTSLLQTTYKKYDISEQQFGLMTNKDDLPSIIEGCLISNDPGGPPPSPSQVAAVVGVRLNRKTPDDYVTDIIDPKPGDGNHSAEYDAFVKANVTTTHQRQVIEGIEYNVDNNGLIIYRGNAASLRLNYIREQLDSLVILLQSGKIDATYINQEVDRLLFDVYRISMLSDGFRDFYIYKHEKLIRL